MNSSASGPVPPCTRGHSATYDPDSKSIFVYGGLREGHRYSELYILNTLTWNWKLVTVSCSHVVFKYSHKEKGMILVCICGFLGKRKRS